MSTRRPHVPRAGKPASGGNDGGSKVKSAHDDGGSRAAHDNGASGAKAAHDDAGAEVLRPDFGGHGKDNPHRPDGASTGTTSGTKPSAKSGTPGAQRPVDREPKPKPHSKVSRLSAAARRDHERESAKYSVREPVVGWTRPAGGGGSAADARPVPAKSFSGRLRALAVVLLTITVLLAPTVQTWVEQRAEINSLQADLAAQEEKRGELKNQLTRWEDPAYIKQQARNRLFLVMPGETRYLVMGADGFQEGQDEPQVTGSPAGDEDVPWVDALFQSVKRSATD